MKPFVKYTLIAGGGLLAILGGIVVYNHYKKQDTSKTTAQKIADTVSTLSQADWSVFTKIFKSAPAATTTAQPVVTTDTSLLA